MCRGRIVYKTFWVFEEPKQFLFIKLHTNYDLIFTAVENRDENIHHDITQVTLSWRGHFFNELHRSQKLLNQIAEHSVPISAAYDVRTGQPPRVRSMQAIPNVNGITGSARFSYRHFYCLNLGSDALYSAKSTRINNIRCRF